MAKKKVPTKEILEKHTPEELVPEKTLNVVKNNIFEKEYWLSLAEAHIKEFTGKKTPLSALYYFAHQLNGDVLFVQMVANAMKKVHDEDMPVDEDENQEKLKEMEAEALDEEIKFDETESE